MNTVKTIRFLLTGLSVAAITFSLAARSQAQTESILFTFTGATTGQVPNSGLVSDASGNLYGVTYEGGKQTRYCPNSSGCGFAFELSPNGSGGYNETIIWTFDDGPDGGNPRGNLIMDAAGNLYGVTILGGYRNKVCNSGSGCGVVYELSPGSSGWTQTVLYTFLNAGDGNEPYGPLAMDASGNLYGATEFGGTTSCGNQSNPCGLIFELSPSGSGTWTETVLHNFTGGNDGQNPFAGVVLDAAGNVYGSASGGNPALCKVANACSVVFKLSNTSSGWKETVLHNFTDGRDGGTVSGPLTLDAQGNLYGTSSLGGSTTCGFANGCGVVFKLSPTVGGAWKETAFDLGGWDGASPEGGVTVDAAGNVYGTAALGGILSCGGAGEGCGVVFKLTPNSSGGWNPSVLHHFDAGTDGEMPGSSLLINAAGDIFGTTPIGGTDNDGIVFEIAPR